MYYAACPAEPTSAGLIQGSVVDCLYTEAPQTLDALEQMGWLQATPMATLHSANSKRATWLQVGSVLLVAALAVLVVALQHPAGTWS
jgi:hypothetical protein